MSRPYVTFPDQTDIYFDDIASLQIDPSDATKLNIGVGGGITDYVYAAGTAAGALQVRAQIKQAINGDFGSTAPLVIVQMNLATIGSVTPNTGTAASDLPFSILGTGLQNVFYVIMVPTTTGGPPFTVSAGTVGRTATQVDCYYTGGSVPADAYTLTCQDVNGNDIVSSIGALTLS